MKEETGRIFRAWAAAALLLALAAAALLWGRMAPAPRPSEDPGNPAAAVSDSGSRVLAGCEIVQTMGFSRCGHSVTRRTAAPSGVVGADFAQTQAYYSLWQIQRFSPDRVEMAREIGLFCPMHRVLSVNEAGEIVLTRNVYGDGMAVDRVLDARIGDFDEETGRKLLAGLGFDSEEDAEAWLQAH